MKGGLAGVAADAAHLVLQGAAGEGVERREGFVHEQDLGLDGARALLGGQAAKVTWITADAMIWRPARSYALWHDRAALHFLMEPAERARYVERMALALTPGGHAIIATFSPDGPETCSGLPIVPHDAASLHEMLGQAFAQVETRAHGHVTPWGSEQKFPFSIFRR